jgi:hypothetical protein
MPFSNAPMNPIGLQAVRSQNHQPTPLADRRTDSCQAKFELYRDQRKCLEAIQLKRAE